MYNTFYRLIVAIASCVLLLVGLTAPNPDPLSAAADSEPARSVETVRGNDYGCAYVVRTGDTLSAIARRYGTTAGALATANGLSDPNRIESGMTLRVPCQTMPPADICSYHTVLRGEYLSLIAARYHTTWRALAQVNRISNPNLIYAGTRLAIPCALPPPAAQWKTFTSTRYGYTIHYPAGWTAQVNTSVPSGANANPEFVKFALNSNTLPQVEIDAMTGTPPFTGYEHCVPNFVFRNLPACKTMVPSGQVPPTDIWVFQRGGAHFRIALVYNDAGSAQLFDDVMRSFQFTQ